MDLTIEYKKKTYSLANFLPLSQQINHKVKINNKYFFLSFDKKNNCFFLRMENNKSFSRIFSLRNIVRNQGKQLIHQEVSFNTQSSHALIKMKCDLDYPNRQKRQNQLEARDMKVFSPISGILIRNLKTEGFVKKNEVILIIDAMKLENKIVAPKDGYLKLNNIKEGSQLKSGDLLFTLENKTNSKA